MAEWLYGRHAVEEALKAGRRKVLRVLVSEAARGQKGGEGANRLSGIENAARAAGVPVERVAPDRLESLARAANHQGVAAEANPYRYVPLAQVVERCREAGADALVLLLDSIQDPQNFGTLLRSAEAAGVTAVVMLDRRQVEVTPAVVNASAGAVEHIEIALANNLSRAIDNLKEAGVWVYALAAEPSATPITKADLRGGLGLVVGSEGQGVGRLVREHCDGALSLPMRGKVESLNAAVAGSIALYEALRQRGG